MIGYYPWLKHANEDDYVIEQPLVIGDFDKWYVAKKSDGTEVSVKFETFFNSKELNESLASLSCHGNLSHPAILVIQGFWFQLDQNVLALVYENIVNDSLQNLLDNISLSNAPAGWNNTKLLINAIGISRGLKYLHNNSIIHRDLKPLNIALDDKFYPHIILNSISKLFIEASSDKYFPNEGTPLFMAPELFDDEGIVSLKNDVYSFSMLLYTLFSGNYPYSSPGEKFSLINIHSQKIRPKIEDKKIPGTITQIMVRCWDQDPEKRPNADEIFVYFKDRVQDLIKEIGDIDENEVLDYIESID